MERRKLFVATGIVASMMLTMFGMALAALGFLGFTVITIASLRGPIATRWHNRREHGAPLSMAAGAESLGQREGRRG
jgi:hypothetical protein